jgi:membrane protein YqaA with SNARE-associated domain
MLSGNPRLLADPWMWGFALLLSVADTAAALVPYYAGRRGTEVVLARFPRLREERLERVQRLYQEHGSGLLFFSFLPMLGVLLPAGAGVAGTRLVVLVPWVLAGKVVRWFTILVLADQALRILS